MKTNEAFAATTFPNTMALFVFSTVLCAAPQSTLADEARFFRIVGPTATTITALSPDGYITWTNAQVGSSYTVQIARSLGAATNWLDYIQVPVSNNVITHRLYDPNAPSDMVLIPAGSFTMGDSLDGMSDVLPPHTVYVSAFCMDKYEVTKALWDEVYQWATNHGYSFSQSDSARGKTNNHPAQFLAWYGAAKWCNARSEMEGRTPAYYTNATQTAVYRDGQVNLQNDWVNWNAGYRLPTEAEWEKAGRGGVSGHRFTWSDTDTINWSRANYSSSPAPYNTSPPFGNNPAFLVGPSPFTSPVGYFAANGYGLHDMTGNVNEWCWDWFGPYAGDSQTDPRGLTSGSARVIRGGSCYTPPDYCRVAARISLPPLGITDELGFRCVLAAGQ